MATRGWGGFRDRVARCHRSGTADRRGARANEAISAAVAEAIETAAGLSMADFSALSGVSRTAWPHGAECADSHARLARAPTLPPTPSYERGLLFGETCPAGRRLITPTGAGRDALAAARPTHARTDITSFRVQNCEHSQHSNFLRSPSVTYDHVERSRCKAWAGSASVGTTPGRRTQVVRAAIASVTFSTPDPQGRPYSPGTGVVRSLNMVMPGSLRHAVAGGPHASFM